MTSSLTFEGYEIRIIPEEDGYYAARFPDFPGIITGGHTPEEALRKAREALAVTLETMRERKIPPSVPKHRFSGQFNVRLHAPVTRHLA